MNKTFKIIQNDKTEEYEIIKILAPSNNNNRYIIYKDNNNYYSSKYTIIDNEIYLEEVKDEYEKEYIKNRLEEYING